MHSKDDFRRSFTAQRLVGRHIAGGRVAYRRMHSIFSIHKTGSQPHKRNRIGGRKLGRPRPEHGPKYQ